MARSFHCFFCVFILAFSELVRSVLLTFTEHFAAKLLTDL